ncbi:YhjD/YihY/BrkB family envelope integrity protein, partial [Pseudomonas citronellolis]
MFTESAEAGFWTCLSTPPLLLGILGTLALLLVLFGADTLSSIIKSTLSTARNFFSPNVVNEIIEPSIRDITTTAGGEVASLGFLISLWAGSSAISSFVDAVVEAHDQTPLRHPVRQRFFALFLYIVMLAFVVITAPVAVVGPRKVSEHIPIGLQNLLHYGYYTAMILGLMAGVTVLYRVALPVP